MFCYQCEQTAGGTGCMKFGVCGKDPATAALQDLLLYSLEGIAVYAHKSGLRDRSIDRFICEALFSTLTNTNFDPGRFVEMLNEAYRIKNRVEDYYKGFCEKKEIKPDTPDGPARWVPAGDLQGLIQQGEQVAITGRIESLGSDTAGLQELLTYGLKGMAAYAHHAMVLGQEDDNVYGFIIEALDFLTLKNPDVPKLLEMNLKCGEVNIRVMEMLDEANTSAYGHPEPTKVRIEPLKGKAILVSGHDLKDLEELLIQTGDSGINIYTHGEMLPAHGYPGLKKYKHLAGNYGGAWQDQRKEFDEFPGAVLMTTNCIQKPKDSYKNRIFTSGPTGWPGIEHIKDRNFKEVIDAALDAPGFTEDGPEKYITVGFARNAVMGAAGKVIELVKSGKLKHFFLIGGCDGAKPGRNYYTEFAEMTPKDTVILTLACGKYRFNKMEFGDIEGIPRLLDVGQCNDAYSAVKIAMALGDAFGCGVNDLPLSLIISWFEQKAVVILLSLLHLGIRNIRLGPTLPAFVTSDVLNVLVDKFNIMPITTAEQDLKAILGEKTAV